MPRVVVDIATSGTDHKLHAILEICFIKVDDSFNIIDTLPLRIRHQNLVVAPDAVAFNGIDIRQSVDWTDESTARNVICTFLANASYEAISNGSRVVKHTYTGLGAAKDSLFLLSFLGPTVYNALFLPRVSELGTLAEACVIAGLIPQPRSSAMLELAYAAGVDVPEEGEHSAVADAEMAQKLGRALFVFLKEAGQRLRGETPCTSFSV